MSTAWSNKKIEHYKKGAVVASISLSVTLFLLKAFASLATGSLAILSSLVDSLSDIVASIVSFVAVKISLKPASCSHRYGYFKAEHISALLQAAFIAGSGLFVVYNGIDRFLHPTVLEKTQIGILIMVFSLIATLALIVFQQYVAKHTQSIAIKADSAHYVVDILTNASIIFSLLIVQFFHAPWLDTLTAFLIAFYLIFYAYKIAREAIDALMDKELPEEIRNNVLKLMSQISDIKGVHDLRTRDLGGVYYFEIHLEMDGHLSLLQAHRLTEEAEQKIKQHYPNAQVLVHQDPSGIKEDHLDDILNDCKN